MADESNQQQSNVAIAVKAIAPLVIIAGLVVLAALGKIPAEAAGSALLGWLLPSPVKS